MFRPGNDPTALFYTPTHSLLYRFPEVVQLAFKQCTDPESRVYKTLTEDFKLTEEDIASVFKFFEEYFQTLLKQQSTEDAFTAFKNAGLPVLEDREPPAFLGVYGVIGAIILSMYHLMAVETKGEVPEKYIYMKEAYTCLANAGTDKKEDSVAGT
jgi:hypothetical protein